MSPRFVPIGEAVNGELLMDTWVALRKKLQTDGSLWEGCQILTVPADKLFGAGPSNSH